MILNVNKYYLIAIDERENMCCVSPFSVETFEQSFDDVHLYLGGDPPATVTKVIGKLYGTMSVTQAKEFKDISYEEVLDLIKE